MKWGYSIWKFDNELPDVIMAEKLSKRKVRMSVVDTIVSEPLNQLAHHVFNPNEFRKEDWSQFGLSPKQVETIDRYVKNGGVFKIKNDVKRLYVVSDSLFQVVMPYLDLPIKEHTKKQYTQVVKSEKKWPKPVVPDSVNLNTADTSLLKLLPGVGSFTAREIVKYRNKLGGFYSVYQLYEIEYVQEETIVENEFRFFIDSSEIRYLDLNKLQAGELVRHPYITWNMASNIYEYRKFHKQFKDTYDLVQFNLLTEELYSKLAPYLIVTQ